MVLHFTVALGCAAFLAAAAPAPALPTLPLQVQIADPGPLSGGTTHVVIAEVPAKSLGVTPAGLEPAPMPDRDAGAPHIAGGITGASLAPAFFSQKAEYAGDGFVGQSSADDTEDRRRQPTAGLGLSIPVRQ